MARPSSKGGKRRVAKTRRVSPKKGRGPAKAKRRVATSTRLKRFTVSDPSKQLQEAREQQAATAEILRVIASSPDDVQPVFEAIVQSAKRLLGGFSSTVFRFVDGMAHLKAFTPTTPQADEVLRLGFPRPITDSAPFQTTQAGEVMQVPDTEAPEYGLREIARARGYRSMLYVPLMNKGVSIGFIAVTRLKLGRFPAHHVQLLRTFADQAVIAIENARLFQETQDSLARQSAMAQVLEVINNSPGDLTPVFDTILEMATQLCGASFGFLNINLGNDMHQNVATLGAPPDFVDMFRGPMYLGPETATGRLVRGESYVHTLDGAHDDAYRLNPVRRALVDLGGARTHLAVPIRRDDAMLGSFTIYRREVRLFSPEMIALVQSFAAQAAVAIDNARLFNETKEALERQTATADILKVIASSPDRVQPVFDAIAESARRLLKSFTAVVTRVIDSDVHLAASTAENEATAHAMQGLLPYPLASDRIHARVARTGQVVSTSDIYAANHVPEDVKVFARAVGWRSMLVVPMLRNGVAVGTVGITRREPGPFDDKTVDLLRTFADQAVIAIENVRMFNETKEALERQTATSDVLKVIASSPSNLQPVFEAIAQRSNELMHGHSTTVFRLIGNMIELAAFTPVSEAADAVLRAGFPRPRSEMPALNEVFRGDERETIDAQSDTEPPSSRDIALARGFRGRFVVPLGSDRGVIGAISITRKEPGSFSDKDKDLLRIFADQAVIAVENARLFNETKEALERQTATADILKVIASSPDNVQPIFDAIAESANRLLGGFSTAVIRFIGELAVLQSFTPTNPAADEVLKSHFPRPIVGFEAAKLVRQGEPATIKDTEDVEDARVKEIARLRGFRSMLFVPLMNGGVPIGTISVTRIATGPFAEHHIRLLQTFADQAVIAIENVRLFNEVQARTVDLSEALGQQTATAEVLSVISMSSGDLAPVFDAMLGKAMELCDANFGVLTTFDGRRVHTAATYGLPPAYEEHRRTQHSLEYGPGTGLYRLLQGEPFAEIEDLVGSEPYVQGDPNRRALVDLGGARCLLTVPLLKDDNIVGFIMIFRQERKRFSEKQITLLKQFAAQAVIAIENARLLNELRQSTSDLSKSLNDLRTAQDRLVQTEKLASLGQLTAGIAHEIKNPLNFVNNFAALSVELTEELSSALMQAQVGGKLQAEVDELSRLLKSNLEKVVQHGKRADSIVKNMLLHSREGSGEQRSADVNALVDESLNLAYHGARAEKPGFNIILQRDFDAAAGSAELFPQEITRALLNVISNGFYAATRRSGEAGFEPTLLTTTKDLGSSVEIRIRDNGTGVAPEVREKMFNPFFTTKPAGEGTGLGLSMTHDIVVKQHGGAIDIESKLGEFTEVRILLPRAFSSIGKPKGRT